MLCEQARHFTWILLLMLLFCDCRFHSNVFFRYRVYIRESIVNKHNEWNFSSARKLHSIWMICWAGDIAQKWRSEIKSATQFWIVIYLLLSLEWSQVYDLCSANVGRCRRSRCRWLGLRFLAFPMSDIGLGLFCWCTHSATVPMFSTSIDEKKINK